MTVTLKTPRHSLFGANNVMCAHFKSVLQLKIMFGVFVGTETFTHTHKNPTDKEETQPVLEYYHV